MSRIRRSMSSKQAHSEDEHWREGEQAGKGGQKHWLKASTGEFVYGTPDANTTVSENAEEPSAKSRRKGTGSHRHVVVLQPPQDDDL
jgi:hypothetical protein